MMDLGLGLKDYIGGMIGMQLHGGFVRYRLTGTDDMGVFVENLHGETYYFPFTSFVSLKFELPR